MASSVLGAAGGLHRELAHKLVLLFLMYISQKVFLTFSWALLPLILRQQGISLGVIGFSTLAYSPWALKFLWAPLVDRCHWPRLGRRKSWMVPLLGLSWVVQPVLALVSPVTDLGLVLVLIFVLNMIFATVDIAVDGYATDILAPGERPWGNTVQMTGYLLGYMTGAGLFLMAYDALGWAWTLWLMAILQMGLIIPVIFHTEMRPHPCSSGSALPENQAGLRGMFRQPGMGWFALALVLITVSDQGGIHLRGPMFADLGLSPRHLGQIHLWAGTPVSIVGTFLGGALIRALGGRRVFWVSCTTASLVSLGSALVWAWGLSAGPGIPWLLPLLVALEKLGLGISTVLVCSMIMEMSAGPRAATRYAALTSVGHLSGFAVMPLAGLVCDWVGYAPFFYAMAAAGLAVLVLGDHIIQHCLPCSAPPEP